MSRSRHWCFTLNNYNETELDHLRKGLTDTKTVRYAVFGKEVGENGTPHLQGYVSYKNPRMFNGVKTLIGSRAHLEVAKGDEDQNRAYCTKSDPEAEEFGTPGNPRKRNDLEAFKDDVKSGERSSKVLRESHSLVAARYPRFFESYIRDHAPKPDLEYHALRDWQQDLNSKLKLAPDRRTIMFYVDEAGNKGKTWFAQYYCELHDNAVLLETGRKEDMAYALPDVCRVLFVNCTRKQCEFLNYSFLESCKDGMVFSTKYESRVKRYSAMHVVVMMNQPPDLTLLSRDRYQINYI